MKKKNIGHIIFTTIEVAIVLAIISGLLVNVFEFLSINLRVANNIIGILILFGIILFYGCIDTYLFKLDIKYQSLINHILIILFSVLVYLDLFHLPGMNFDMMREQCFVFSCYLFAGVIILIPLSVLLLPPTFIYNIYLNIRTMFSNDEELLKRKENIVPSINVLYADVLIFWVTVYALSIIFPIS